MGKQGHTFGWSCRCQPQNTALFITILVVLTVWCGLGHVTRRPGLLGARSTSKQLKIKIIKIVACNPEKALAKSGGSTPDNGTTWGTCNLCHQRMEPLAHASNSRVRNGARCGNTRGMAPRAEGLVFACTGIHRKQPGSPGSPMTLGGFSYCSSDVPQDEDGWMDPKQISVAPPEAVTREKKEPAKCGVSNLSWRCK